MIEKLKNIHPGEILLHEFLIPLGISQNKLGTVINVPPRRINEICLNKRAVSVDTAIRLGKYFDTGAQFWLNLQHMYDIEETTSIRQEAYSNIKSYVHYKKAA